MIRVAGGTNLINAEEILKRVGVGQGMKVGDFGCGGTGYFTLTAGQLAGEEGKVYAVDVLKGVLSGVAEKVKARGLSNVEMVWSNLEIYGATKIEGASLDFGMLVNTLYQTTKDEEVIKEVVRTIKPGGKLLVIDWKNEEIPLGPPKEKRVETEEVKRAAIGLGLREVDNFEAGPYHLAMVFVK
ncbi:class I SAM-dependent methyltransferase [Candidatus Falkowbacteria bacterium]|nr:class I SAM-dependent methyltransferase [Candidatus Falkowbacteria bacterium]